MSALTHRECLRAALLDALGGEPCTDLDGKRPGVWLPETAWQAIADFVMSHGAVDMASTLEH